MPKGQEVYLDGDQLISLLKAIGGVKGRAVKLRLPKDATRPFRVERGSRQTRFRPGGVLATMRVTTLAVARRTAAPSPHPALRRAHGTPRGAPPALRSLGTVSTAQGRREPRRSALSRAAPHAAAYHIQYLSAPVAAPFSAGGRREFRTSSPVPNKRDYYEGKARNGGSPV